MDVLGPVLELIGLAAAETQDCGGAYSWLQDAVGCEGDTGRAGIPCQLVVEDCGAACIISG